MLVTWGQGGIPFAGNVALDKTRISDSKVLLDWNHKPEFSGTQASCNYSNLTLGTLQSQSPWVESDGSGWKSVADNGIEVINDGKNKSLLLPPAIQWVSGSNIINHSVAEGKPTSITFSESPGCRVLFKVSSTSTAEMSRFHLFSAGWASNTGLKQFNIFYLPASSNRARYAVQFQDDNNQQIATTSTLWDADTDWHECVFQYDAATQTLSYFYDGNRVLRRVSLNPLQTSVFVNLAFENRCMTIGMREAFDFQASTLGYARISDGEYWRGVEYDVDAETIPTYGIHHQTGTVTLLNSTAAGKLTAIDATAIGKITKVEHYTGFWATIAENSAGLTFPLTGIDTFSDGLFRLTLASTDTVLQRDTPELISFLANIEPAGGRKIIQPYRFGPKIIHIGGII